MVEKPESGGPDGPAVARGHGRPLFLLGAVALTGAAVMIVEMTAVRALQPFFGATTWVWTNVIAVAMASLAVGYAVGGRVADRRPSPGLLFSLLAAGGFVLALSATQVRVVAGWFLEPGLDLEGVTSAFVRGSLGASLVLFAPVTLLLGMASPLAIRLLSERGVGRAAGNVFALGTTGSIAGTYLPVLLLVPSVGARGTLFVAAALLLLPAVAGLLSIGRVRGAAAVLSLSVLVGALLVPGGRAPVRDAPEIAGVETSRVVREVESAYQFLTVREDRMPDGTIHDVLTVNEGLQAAQSLRVRGRVLTGSRYYDAYSLLPVLLDVESGDELRGCIVGLACGVIAMQWRHFWEGPYSLRVDGAEIDPEIVFLGREFFDLPGPEAGWLRVYEMDGRRMLASLPGEDRYDMLVVDAFANELYIPFHLGTVEFFDLCRRRLRPGGILAMNVYAYGPDSGHLAALAHTLARVFGRCYRIRQRSGGNFILLARLGDVPPDFTRLMAARIRDRFGERAEVGEWGDLLTLADQLPARVTAISKGEGGRLLTDDHAPLERLTDRFLGEIETEIKGWAGRGPAIRSHLERVGRRLILIAAGWMLLLAGGGWYLRRRGWL